MLLMFCNVLAYATWALWQQEGHTQMPFDLGPEPGVKISLFFLSLTQARVVGFATENGLISLYVCGMYAC